MRDKQIKRGFLLPAFSLQTYRISRRNQANWCFENQIGDLDCNRTKWRSCYYVRVGPQRHYFLLPAELPQELSDSIAVGGTWTIVETTAELLSRSDCHFWLIVHVGDGKMKKSTIVVLWTTLLEMTCMLYRWFKRTGEEVNMDQRFVVYGWWRWVYLVTIKNIVWLNLK